jgi:radical SAM superfamily enzyme YgiQ (UPF0313 family)
MLANLPMGERWQSRGGPELTAENMGLGYLAASLREAGRSVGIVDAIAEGLKAEAVLHRIVAARPRLVGLAIFQTTRLDVLTFCRALKRAAPGVKIILGGQLARLAASDLLSVQEIDLLCTGEGERPICEVVTALDSGSFGNIPGIAWRDDGEFRTNSDPPLMTDLDQLPWPARDTLPAVLARGGVARVVGSRGCNFRCAFCSVHRFLGPSTARWRTRSVDDVLGEIDYLRARFHIDTVAFNEDNFFGSSKSGYARAEQMAEALIGKAWGLKFAIACRADDVVEDRFRLLREAGLAVVEIGIESGAASALKRWAKGTSPAQNFQALEILDRLGIAVNPGFIMFDAHTTPGEMQQNLEFLRRCTAFRQIFYKIELRFAQKMIPYIGTAIRERYAGEGLLHSDDLLREAYDDYTFRDPRIEAACRVMQRWEQASGPVRWLCWNLALDRSVPDRGARGLRLLEELADLTFRIYEAEVEAAAQAAFPWDAEASSPWPERFDAQLMALARKALKVHNEQAQPVMAAPAAR